MCKSWGNHNNNNKTSKQNQRKSLHFSCWMIAYLNLINNFILTIDNKKLILIHIKHIISIIIHKNLYIQICLYAIECKSKYLILQFILFPYTKKFYLLNIILTKGRTTYNITWLFFPQVVVCVSWDICEIEF